MRRTLAFALMLGCSSSGSSGGPNDGGVTSDSATPPGSLPVLPGAPACSGDLCWFFPPNHGDDLNAVWAANDKDMWAVGARGSIVHYDGAQWSHMQVGKTELHAIWGSSPTSLWAVGLNTVLRYNGAWAPMAGAPMGSFQHIVASSDSDVWLLGGTDAAHFDGAAWTSQKLTTTVTDAKKVGSEVWILAGGSVLKLAAPGATPVTLALPGAKPDGAYKTLVASPSGKAWAFGTNGTAAELVGDSFQALSVGTTDISYAAVLPNGEVLGVSQSSVFKLAPTKWERQVNVTGNPYVTENLQHAFATAGGQFWAVGTGGATAHFDGVKWSEAGGRISSEINELHGTSADDLWVSTQFSIQHYRGGKWTGTSIGTVSFPGPVRSVAVDEAWSITGVFTDTLTHSKGWTNYKQDKQKFVDLSATSPSDVWAVGTLAMHWDGAAWTANTVAGAPFTTVYQSAPSDIWLGSATGVQRGDGATWSPIDTGVTGAPRMLRGKSATDVWAVYDSDVRHFNGTTWESRPAPTEFKVTGLTVTGDNDAWAWGKPGAVLHYTGGSWVELPIPSSATTTAIWVQAGDIWVGTNEGGLIRKK